MLYYNRVKREKNTLTCHL